MTGILKAMGLGLGGLTLGVAISLKGVLYLLGGLAVLAITPLLPPLFLLLLVWGLARGQTIEEILGEIEEAHEARERNRAWRELGSLLNHLMPASAPLAETDAGRVEPLAAFPQHAAPRSVRARRPRRQA